MGRLFQHHGKGILVDHLHGNVRLRGHAARFRREVEAQHLPRVHPAVGQHGRAVGKKAAALKFDCPGKLRRNGTLAQKVPHKRSILGLQGVRHREIQTHAHPSFARKTDINSIAKNAFSCKSCFFMVL